MKQSKKQSYKVVKLKRSALALTSVTLITVALDVLPVQAANLVINGDFESGNTGFSSDYIFTNINTTAQEYTISTDPNSFFRFFPSFGDHTTGTGNMMIVNGATVSNQKVWEQTINVTENTIYDLSTWVASLIPVSPANLQFLINSTLIGTFRAPTTATIWEEFTNTWNSETATSATITIVDTNLAFNGNDFALDDISFTAISDSGTPRPIPEPLTILGSFTALGFGAMFKRKNAFNKEAK